jgi:Zn-dependent protease with chaperone function
MKDSIWRNQQIITLRMIISQLSEKAGLRRVPELFISKKERFASVNIFQFHICVGENLLSLWAQGKFDESDIEAVVAHEIGHLMDLRGGSRTKSFRNLIFESAWFVCGLVPFIACLLIPSVSVFQVTVVQLSIVFAVGWGLSVPWLIKRFERKIEFEADRNAALYLVSPEHLSSALAKIKTLMFSVKYIAPRTRMTGVAGKLSHPSFDDRIRRLNGLSNYGIALMKLWEMRLRK